MWRYGTYDPAIHGGGTDKQEDMNNTKTSPPECPTGFLHLMLQQINANKGKLNLQHKPAYHERNTHTWCWNM
jgi:hypothetical protein